jgi:predicted MPP superfamily phosphohydrolase
VIERVSIPVTGLPVEFHGFRIAQFTDLHVGPTIKRDFVERVVEQLQGLDADLIAFTGDLVDGSVGWLRDDVAPLAALRAKNGVYFVTGNHEYYSGASPWIREARRLGFDVLMNEHRVLRKGGAGLVLAGITDYGAGEFIPAHRSDPAAAVSGSPEGMIRVLLAHQPRSVFAAEQAGVAVQLSGHTHGGQFFPWNHLATLSQPYIKGLHRHGRTWVYVSRGTAYWGPPVRLFNPPEITVVTLLRA